MDGGSTRWTDQTQTQEPWERGALDCAPRRLLGRVPYLAAARFGPLTQDGAVNRGDLSALAPGAARRGSLDGPGIGLCATPNASGARESNSAGSEWVAASALVLRPEGMEANCS